MSQSISSKVKTFFKSVMKPSPSAVFQAVKSLKPHVPMIKFRYGGVAGHSTVRATAPSSPAVGAPARGAPSASVPASPAKPNAAVQLPIIEDWQLPRRYQRRPLDPIEIECINVSSKEERKFLHSENVIHHH